jgi:hypothetical protein
MLALYWGWFACVPFALADTVRLRFSFKKYQGTVVSLDEQTVVFKQANGKQTTWPRNKVASIKFSAGSAALKTGHSGKDKLTGQVYPMVGQAAELSPVAAPVTGLAEFKTKTTQFLGLYRLPNRGTCWLTLPRALPQALTLQFDVAGKWNPAKQNSRMLTPPPAEPFAVSARFFDETGQLLGQAPMVRYAATPRLTEWFEFLTGMSGVATPQTITWQLPARTKSVEWFVAQPQGPNVLVGYLTRVVLVP